MDAARGSQLIDSLNSLAFSQHENRDRANSMFPMFPEMVQSVPDTPLDEPNKAEESFEFDPKDDQ